MHARALRKVLRVTIATALAGGLSGFALASCSSSEPGESVCRVTGRSDGGSSSCESFEVFVSGSGDKCGFADAGFLSGQPCERFCGAAVGRGGFVFSCTYSEQSGIAKVFCSEQCVIDGRRAPSVDGLTAEPHDLGAWLARAAYGEAASVHAFAQIEQELAAHGAPRTLRRAAQRARRDEARHARLATRLARRHHGSVVRVRARRVPVRDVLELALDNAREGCGRELLGACVAMVLAERASTAELRGFYSAIAGDEIRHAAFSLRLHSWLVSRLDSAGVARVESARREALESFGPPSEELSATLGFPSRVQLARMAELLAK